MIVMTDNNSIYAELLKDYPDVLNVQDVCNVLKISKATIHRQIKSGKLKCIAVGCSLRIPKSFLIEYLNNSIR